MSTQRGLRSDDACGARQPTSHERHAGQPWDASYRDGPAPWDIGAPQPAVMRLSSEGAFAGRLGWQRWTVSSHTLSIADDRWPRTVRITRGG